MTIRARLREHATLAAAWDKSARMNLSALALRAATDTVSAVTGWLYDMNEAMWKAAVDADHVTLSMIEQGEEPGVPVSEIRVARKSPHEYLWHATLGLPASLDQDVIPTGMRVLVCSAGVAPSRDKAHQAAGVSLGLHLAPYLPAAGE